MKNKAKKKIRIQAKKVYEVARAIMKRDKDKLDELPVDTKGMYYKCVGFNGLYVDIEFYKWLPKIESDREVTVRAQADYKNRTIRINYHYYGPNANKKEMLTSIRHELGHIYEYEENNDLSEEAAKKYE